MRAYRDILKHSCIYGIGQVLCRLASVLLLPVYTHYLRPADYAVVAILDVATGLLAVVIGSGMVSAVNRYHFEAADDEGRRKVWWTGLAFLCLSAFALSLPTILLRWPISHFLIGPSEPRAGLYLALAMSTIGLNCIGQLADGYLRIRNWSGTAVTLSLVRLLLNIVLNVAFLVGWGKGVLGVLLGNLVTSIVMTAIQIGYLVRYEWPFAFDRGLMRKLLAFGSPLIATALLSVVMHDADRYLLRMFVSMDEVGIYSLAYQVGQGVNALCLVPFSAIWSVVVYEIASLPNFRQAYARVFGCFFDGLALVLLGASFFAHPVLDAITPRDYSAAADLIPVICLAYLFFSLHDHFRVPVLLAKKTLNMLPAFVLAAALNIAANCALIPWFGSLGAAWASVLTFFAFSMTGLLIYRKIDRYPYPFGRCLGVLAGMTMTWLAWRASDELPTAAHLGLAAVLWVVWAIGLSAIHLRTWLKERAELGPDGAAAEPVESYGGAIAVRSNAAP